MRELIDAFFRERSIVNHHIASFNDFLPTIDNPNSRMQRIVDNLRSSPEDERRGIIKLDEDRTEGDVIEIRIGRKRDERGRIDLEAKPTITLGLPVVKEANGATHPLNPMEARLRNLNYTAPIYLDFTVIENGIEREPERVHIGNFPVMVKSKRCLLYKENMETEGELSLDEYRQQLVREFHEDPFDPGGYFIIGGTERALISLEDLAPNRVLVEFNERYGRKVEVAKVFSQKEGYRALTLMEKKKDGQLIVSVPTASGQIPLIILMKALGMEKDEDIYNAVVSRRRWRTSSTRTSKSARTRRSTRRTGSSRGTMRSVIWRRSSRQGRRRSTGSRRWNRFWTAPCCRTSATPARIGSRRRSSSAVSRGRSSSCPSACDARTTRTITRTSV